MHRLVSIAFGALWAAACSGELREEAPTPAPSSPVPPAARVDDEETRALAIEPAPVDETTFLADHDAVPAWELVRQRARTLARRGQSGVGFGRHRAGWLIDEVEGEGALAIRLAVPEGTVLEDGMRLAVRGAWDLSPERRWEWRATRAWSLPERAESLTTEPGLTIPEGVMPDAAVPVSEVQKGGVAVFKVVGLPLSEGHGWEVADPDGKDPIARVILPGEAGAYGGQDMRTEDESWPVSRGGVYAVGIDRIWRPRTGSELAVAVAAGRPVRVH